CVFSETLLTGYQGVAVMVILHVADCQIVRSTYVMVRTEDEASSFAPEKLPNCIDFLRRCFLIRDHVVQSKHHDGVCVCKYPFVQRKLEPGLIDPLKNRDNMSCSLPNKLLKRRPGPEEQFQRTRNPLLEL